MNVLYKTAYIIASSMVGFALPAASADMIEQYKVSPPNVAHHTLRRIEHHNQPRLIRTITSDCTPLIYEYRTSPSYTEVKLVCAPAWRGPVGRAESGGTNSTSTSSVNQ